MPKVKTHSGAAKRFHITASGQIKRKHTNLRHLLRKRSTKRKRHLNNDVVLLTCDFGHAKRLLKLPNRKVNIKPTEE